MRKLIFILLLAVIGCTPNPPVSYDQSTTKSTIDTAFVSQMTGHTAQVTHTETPIPELSTPEPQSSSTLNLEIKENITLDKSLTFYHYLPTANSGYKSDRVFYFLLDNNSLTLQQYDKNMAMTLSCDFTVSKPWTRNLTIEYNILKTSLSSSTNKDISFEIGLKNSKVAYVKLGENKFYAKAPVVIKTNECKDNGIEYHVIKAGENLKLLADSKCMEVKTLLTLNPKVKDRENFVVYPGEKIRIK